VSGTLEHNSCRVCSRRCSSREDISTRTENWPGPQWWYCPTPRTPEVADVNGEILLYGKPCQTNYCFECVSHNAARVEIALHLVEPQVFISINDVGNHHTDCRAAMKVFRCHLRNKTHLRFEDLYVLERYAEKGHNGLGVHLYGHGDLPDHTDVLRAAWAAGMDPQRRDNPVNVQPISHHGNLGYAFKHTTRPDTLKSFLDDNGGSLMNTTRGFWRIPGHAPAPQGYRGLLRQGRTRA
jgi:hypothetical protein